MKAIICQKLGPPEELVFGDMPSRELARDEVRIRVEAAGVNFPDVLIIQGKYQIRGEPPFTPGTEVAGRVIERGANVTHLEVGDRVLAACMIGGFAEETVAPAAACSKLPDGMSSVQAAGFVITYGTTIHALEQRGELKPGESLLVLGASGGVGVAAIQVGKLMGARVIAAASSEEKLAFCRAQGADEGVDYSAGSLKDAVKQLTGGAGADVIYDPVGGALAQECFSCIAWRGRFLVVGFASGTIPEIALNRLLLKGASAVGVFWGAFMAREPEAHARNMEKLFGWFKEGRLIPHVSKEYPLKDAPRALRDLMERKALGKIVLVP